MNIIYKFLQIEDKIDRMYVRYIVGVVWLVNISDYV